MKTDIIFTTPDCEIETSRIISASREIVYRAWTEPDHLKIWWGPSGFTNTFNTFDFRVGGKWSFVMHGPDKGNYVNECEFIKIESPWLIAWKRHSKPLFQVLVTFEEVSANKTKIVFKQIFNSANECDKIRKFTVGKNDENFDRLEKELLKMLP